MPSSRYLDLCFKRYDAVLFSAVSEMYFEF
ncbi:hypothetical protein A2U01_0044047 [Trifolium medium]|uniref:Uncharacterized protein n=1 Tax=Trifolium medium TaxID=97028 RepID=A0A392QG07_9FABA|nr:hypothetical protein [Trifolium medium]